LAGRIGDSLVFRNSFCVPLFAPKFQGFSIVGIGKFAATRRFVLPSGICVLKKGTVPIGGIECRGKITR
jgi:hypothetical protein